jgi:predicted  nucleic acid-binding Zn-ribbon protein
MANPQIEKLLIVQDRDIALQKIETELKRIPQELSVINAHIATEAANTETASQSLKAKEVERNELNNEIQSKEAAINRFRTQQLEVKKNDEYRALTKQIEQSEAEISAIEERVLELMLEIDEAREVFESEKHVIEARVQEQKEQIELLAEREANLKESAKEAQAQLDKARELPDETYLAHYDRVRHFCKRPPYLARVEDRKCGGCHLRVSNEVAQGASDSNVPHFCDQCARMVYA